MTLPASGALRMQDIVNQYGGAAPHSLSEYYRGGANVPNQPWNNNIPTSGQIRFSNFYSQGDSFPNNGGNYTFTIATFNSRLSLINGNAGTAGQAWGGHSGNSFLTQLTDYHNPISVSPIEGEYQIRLTPTVSTFNTSHSFQNVWMTMSITASHMWMQTLVGGSGQTRNSQGTLEIRRTNDLVVVATMNVNLTANIP